MEPLLGLHEGAVQKALRKAKARHAKGVERGVKRAGLFLLRESQKIVPIDTAALKNSGNTRAEGEGLDIEVIVSYGTDYAVFVHEDLNARHKKGKKAKFLEGPAREKRRELQQIIQDAVR